MKMFPAARTRSFRNIVARESDRLRSLLAPGTGDNCEMNREEKEKRREEKDMYIER